MRVINDYRVSHLKRQLQKLSLSARWSSVVSQQIFANQHMCPQEMLAIKSAFTGCLQAAKEENIHRCFLCLTVHQLALLYYAFYNKVDYRAENAHFKKVVAHIIM